jgi:acyl-[acyl-carrier-protein]-phospholipid O-acyltransferase/long-chain-fatty-acid--[acyl-carrier-protein] ligase
MDLSVGQWGILVLALALILLTLICFQPYATVRFLLWLLTHTFYRVRVQGGENVPARGGALLVCNPVTSFDWLLLLAARRRRIRFILATGGTHSRVMDRLLRATGVLAIDLSAGPRALLTTVRQARAALAAGELVCVFTEGFRIGPRLLVSFSRLFGRIVKKSSAPIVPVCFDQFWGSLLRRGEEPGPSRGLLWKWPQTLPYPVSVTFGEPLPASTGAAEVRQALQLLSARCAVARSVQRRPVHRQFVRMAARHPFRSCFLDSSDLDRRQSYGRALAGVIIFRRLLVPILGDAPMVAVWLPSSMAGAFVNITLAMLGKASVNLNYTASPEAVQSCLRQCGARHVLTSRRFMQRLALDPGPGVELIYLEDFAPRVGQWLRLTRFLAVLLLPGWVLEHWVLRLGRHRLGDLATVIFSSGSTGEPKGVMLSHGNIAANIASMIQTVSLAPQDRALGVLPLFHSFGYTVTLWAPLQVGASVLYHADPRQAKEIGELCRRFQCSIYVSTATFLRFCLRKCEPEDFRSLRFLICGAEKLPVSLADDFHEKFGVLPLEGYGCTELSPVVCTNLPDVPAGDSLRIGNRPGTVGQPLPGVVARIVHPETLAPLPAGQEGLLLVYGGNVMQGYLSRPDLTREVLREGWYVTGDMARLDADGFITLTGRLSRFAKCGGEMVPLEKVEEVLHDILGTSERICAVTCVPDESRGERLIVLYLRQNGLEVRLWWQQLSGRGLPNLWIPAERDFIAVPELPLLGSGKLNLKSVKEMAVALTQKK